MVYLMSSKKLRRRKRSSSPAPRRVQNPLEEASFIFMDRLVEATDVIMDRLLLNFFGQPIPKRSRQNSPSPRPGPRPGSSKPPSPSSIPSLYEILEVSVTASPETITAAWKSLAKRHHPDKGGNQARMKEINEAYEVLSDPLKRKMYDRIGGVK